MDAGSAKGMSAVPAARYLTEFGIEGATGAIGPGDANGSPKATARDKLEEAFARGVESGRAATQEETEAKLAGQQTLFAKRLELERQKWAIGTGDKLATTLARGLLDLESRIADSVARVLRPFLEAELHRQSIAELQSSLGALVATEAGVSLQISGPADVLDVLRTQLKDKKPPAVFEVTDDSDVRIVAGQAVLETHLKDWMGKVEEAMR
jgi:flagellar biosynthesis/type III secretory pathway protein FliH